jgi:putative acetyltransferase
MHDVTPPEGVFAFDGEALADPTVTFFSGRVGGAVVTVGALKHLDDGHAEIKSMHTVAEARGCGYGGAMLDHLLAAAAERGYRRISLETGRMDEFAPARALYERAGFSVCPPFGPYVGSETSICMTRAL